MKFIVITPSKGPANEFAILSHMLNNGLPTLHVRKPSFSKEEMVKYIEQFPEEHQNKIVLHSYHQILLDYDLKGLHLSKRHRKKPFKAWLNQTLIELRMGRKISVSTSSKSLSSMADNYKEFEYVMLTPVFADPQGHRSNFSPPLLQQVLRSFPDKIVARGGSTADSIEKARNMGFAGIAFHNFFWTHEDPVKEFDKVMERFNQLGVSIT
ncbi:MAG TPA: thiamine phosphate synthase [Bacteroidia bacterium]|nr:thiamine phosphate synthase [Bacteroidia bacterium]